MCQRHASFSDEIKASALHYPCINILCLWIAFDLFAHNALQVIPFKKLLEELQNLGEVTITVAGHSVEKENMAVKISTNPEKICFALDQPKERKKIKAPRPQGS